MLKKRILTKGMAASKGHFNSMLLLFWGLKLQETVLMGLFLNYHTYILSCPEHYAKL